MIGMSALIPATAGEGARPHARLSTGLGVVAGSALLMFPGLNRGPRRASASDSAGITQPGSQRGPLAPMSPTPMGVVHRISGTDHHFGILAADVQRPVVDLNVVGDEGGHDHTISLRRSYPQRPRTCRGFYDADAGFTRSGDLEAIHNGETGQRVRLGAPNRDSPSATIRSEGPLASGTLL
jgi:hypothetical protein